MTELEKFLKCTTKPIHKDGRFVIKCNLGLWSVEAYHKHLVITEAMHYFRQYANDGEYSEFIGGKTASENLQKANRRSKMRNVECFKDSFITSYGEVISPTEKITLHFAGAPVGMHLPWTLVHAKESYCRNGEKRDMIAVTVKSANGVVKTFHDDGCYDISGCEGEYNFNLYLNSPFKHNAQTALAQEAAKQKGQADDRCVWIENEGYWETCGNDWFPTGGTPSDNHMNYCPMCGKVLVEAEP